MLRLYWMLLIASFLGIISLPLAACQDSLQPTPSVKSPVLPNAVVYVGSTFSYNISENVFDCDVDSIVVSCSFYKVFTVFYKFIQYIIQYCSNSC